MSESSCARIAAIRDALSVHAAYVDAVPPAPLLDQLTVYGRDALDDLAYLLDECDTLRGLLEDVAGSTAVHYRDAETGGDYGVVDVVIRADRWRRVVAVAREASNP